MSQPVNVQWVTKNRRKAWHPCLHFASVSFPVSLPPAATLESEKIGPTYEQLCDKSQIYSTGTKDFLIVTSFHLTNPETVSTPLIRSLNETCLLPLAPSLPLFQPRSYISTPKTDLGSLDPFTYSSQYHHIEYISFLCPSLYSSLYLVHWDKWPSLKV
jgi:hypothetical protein